MGPAGWRWAQPPHQLLQHLRLLGQGGAAPEQIRQPGMATSSSSCSCWIVSGCWLVLWRSRGRPAGCASPGRCAWGGGSVLPADLIDQVLRADRAAPAPPSSRPCAARSPRRSRAAGSRRKGPAARGISSSGSARPAPLALQHPQLAGHRVHQLLRVVRQVEGALLQHGGQEGHQLVARRSGHGQRYETAGRGHGFHPHRRIAAEAEPGVRPHRGHAPGQFPGAGHPHRTLGSASPAGRPAPGPRRWRRCPAPGPPAPRSAPRGPRQPALAGIDVLRTQSDR